MGSLTSLKTNSSAAFAVLSVCLGLSTACGSSSSGTPTGGAGSAGHAGSAGSAGSGNHAGSGGSSGDAGGPSGGEAGAETGGSGGSGGSSMGGSGGSAGGLADLGIVIPKTGRILMPDAPTSSVGTPTGNWQIVPGKLTTQWAADVSPDAPRPEYPRPNFVRTAWASLDGLWDYSLQNISGGGTPMNGKILVPYPFESALSGVAGVLTETEKLVYHRTFTIPPSWKGWGVQLNFGAVDFQANVSINGKALDTHSGGYDAFSFDITPYLIDGTQDIVVSVVDPSDKGVQPVGKQTIQQAARGPIYYTATSGIWQSVWLEPLPLAGRITALKVTPDLDGAAVTVVPSLAGDTSTAKVHVQVFDAGKVVVENTVAAGGPIALTIPAVKAWSPDSPTLYDIRVDLLDADGVTLLDSVGSYTGIRKIALAKDPDGYPTVFLNNAQFYEMGILDQGFWPDGIYTAPTDDALKSDIQVEKSLNFNMIRKHIKVEPARWYYWCDKLGMLVWQDMPAPVQGTVAGTEEATRKEFVAESTQIINEHLNYPSIVTWVIFNEGWGEQDVVNSVATLTKLDPTRLVDGTTGENVYNTGNFIDLHHYAAPAAYSPSATRASILGEFGGIGYYIPDHQWSTTPFSYEQVTTNDALTATYVGFVQQLFHLRTTLLLSGSVFTQLTDVEGEQNGLMTYDRAFLKVDRPTIAAINAGTFLKPIVPTSEVDVQSWHYTTSNPGATFAQNSFVDSAWTVGPGAFGFWPQANDYPINTAWSTPDIWLRRHFTFAGPLPTKLVARFFHDEDMQVYLNGTQILTAAGFITFFDQSLLSPPALSALQVGDNVLAVHCRQTSGGQFIDVGLYDGG